MELFTEPGPGRRGRVAYRCVGVRVRDAVAGGMRDGGLQDFGMRDAGMRGVGMRGVGMRDGGMRDAGKRDRRTRSGGTGGDETVRFAYRRMIGWRADRARLTEVVRCYAPSVPVREGTDWPPAMNPAQACRPSS